MKHCNKCNNDFPATPEYFYRDRGKKDGLSTTCKSCKDISSKRWIANNKEQKYVTSKRYREAHKQKLSEYQKIYRQEHEEQMREYKREWRLENIDRFRENQRRYQRDNRDKVNKWQSECYHNNLEKSRTRGRIKALNRRARMKDLPNTLTPDQWDQVLNYFDQRCAVCGRLPSEHEGLTIAADHWIPVSDPNCPGTVIWNIVPLCHGNTGCNNSKSNQDPREWLKNDQAILDRIAIYQNWAAEALYIV